MSDTTKNPPRTTVSLRGYALPEAQEKAAATHPSFSNYVMELIERDLAGEGAPISLPDADSKTLLSELFSKYQPLLAGDLPAEVPNQKRLIANLLDALIDYLDNHYTGEKEKIAIIPDNLARFILSDQQKVAEFQAGYNDPKMDVIKQAGRQYRQSRNPDQKEA